MAKKRFTDDLESLFGDTEEKSFSLASDESVTVEVQTSQPRRVPKSGSKGFSQNLDAFLAESFGEAEANEQPDEPPSQPVRRRPARRRGSGLDILIRNTRVEQQPAEETPEPDTKRLTVVIDKEQLQQLKAVARREKMYLKDIIGSLVEEYLEQSS